MLTNESNGLNTGSWIPFLPGSSQGLEIYVNLKNVKRTLTLFLSGVCVCVYF